MRDEARDEPISIRFVGHEGRTERADASGRDQAEIRTRHGSADLHRPRAGLDVDPRLLEHVSGR